MMATLSYTPSVTSAGPSAQLSAEDQSKDAFFVRLGELAEEMIAGHGKDFAMGTLLLSARFIAENKPLIRRDKEPAS
jgi:hypothetical protein